MAEFTTHKPGTFCWVDLGTTDPQNAKKFYCELFGWEVADMPMGESFTYTFFTKNGKQVCAMYKLTEQQLQMGLPPNWLSYVLVEDAAATLAKAKELGGSVFMEAMEVMQEGVSGLFGDPEGAYLGIWQPKNHIGVAYKNEPGSICWFEHAGRENEKSIPFLEKLFGWTSNTQDMGGMLYTTFSMDVEMVCGAYIMPPELDGVPPHWLPYFMTDNIDLLLEKTSNLGGQVLMPKTMVPNVGYFSVVRDPQGAVFGVLQ